MQTWNGSSKISLKSLQVLLSKYHVTDKIKVLLCIYVIFKGRIFKSSVIITYFNIFQAKTCIEPDNIHEFTEISIFFYSRWNFLKQISN